MKKLIFLLCAVFVPAYPACAAKNDYALKVKTLKGSSSNYTYELHYPQFPKQLAALNAKFENFAKDTLNSFDTNYGSIKNENGEESELRLDFSTYSINNSLISVRFNVYTYTGGAHGNSDIETFNIRPKNNSAVTLAELFPDTDKALKTLSAYSRKILLENIKNQDGAENLDMQWFEQGSSSDTANFQLFTLDGDNIYVQFKDYQVAPHCYGEMEAKIPLSAFNSAKDGADEKAELANPASVNCEKTGGTLKITKKPDGGEYGICVFEDNRQCEEWALFRGECPKGGVKITGYTTPETIFCAITGHNVIEGERGAPGSCVIGGETCPALEFYKSGSCAAPGR
jgi:hypothetical protein